MSIYIQVPNNNDIITHVNRCVKFKEHPHMISIGPSDSIKYYKVFRDIVSLPGFEFPLSGA